MLIVMAVNAGPGDIARVQQKIEALGFRAHIIPGEQRTAMGSPATGRDRPGGI